MTEPAKKQPLEVVDCFEMAKMMPVDTDFPLTMATGGPCLIIRLSAEGEKGGREYPSEKHDAVENIVALEGKFAMITEGGRTDVSRGQCVRIPIGVEHRYAPDSEAIILVHFAAKPKPKAEAKS